MRIAVNTRFLLKDRLEGIGWFTLEILKRIVQDHPEHEFLFLFDRKYPNEYIFGENVRGKVVSPQARHPLLWYVWFEHAIPKVLKKEKVDLFVSTDGFLSLKAKTKTLLTIHDLAFEHFPEHIPPMARKYYLRNTPLFAEKADQIVTVSEFSKKDIMDRYDIAPEKIDVVHNGVSTKYMPLEHGKQEKIRMQYTTGAPYFLFISALQPRKNVIRLLQAFDTFKNDHPGPEKLIIAGKHTWIKAEIELNLEHMSNADEVIFVGHIPQQELSQLLGSAIGLIYPSLFEGFGIPIIEAMQAEVPVITSNVSSMPEVAGNAALLIDPYDINDMARAMKKISRDPGLRSSLIKNGRVQREKFSWDRSARKFWESMEKIF